MGTEYKGYIKCRFKEDSKDMVKYLSVEDSKLILTTDKKNEWVRVYDDDTARFYLKNNNSPQKKYYISHVSVGDNYRPYKTEMVYLKMNSDWLRFGTEEKLLNMHADKRILRLGKKGTKYEGIVVWTRENDSNFVTLKCDHITS
jgi:hypothetical protein